MEMYKWYKNKGICVNCRQEKAIKNKVHCPNCNDDRNYRAIEYHNKNKDSINKRRRDLTKYRIENKLCTKCGTKLLEGYTYKFCENCRLKERIYRKKKAAYKLRKWDIWRLEGKCVRCGGDKLDNSNLCIRCYNTSLKNLENAKGYKDFTTIF